MLSHPWVASVCALQMSNGLGRISLVSSSVRFIITRHQSRHLSISLSAPLCRRFSSSIQTSSRVLRVFDSSPPQLLLLLLPHCSVSHLSPSLISRCDWHSHTIIGSPFSRITLEHTQKGAVKSNGVCCNLLYRGRSLCFCSRNHYRDYIMGVIFLLLYTAL